MAEVDFTNAVLSFQTANPCNSSYLGFMNLYGFTDANGNRVSNDLNNSVTTSEEGKLVVKYIGSFSTSGTEFYFLNTSTGSYLWKMSNITFSTGDTYNFKIECNITNQ